MYVCRSAHEGDTFPLGTTSLLEGSSGLQEAYTKACPNSAKQFTAACWFHVRTPYSAISFFIPVHQKRSFKSKFILVFPGCIEYGESWASWSINFLIYALLGTYTRSSNHKMSCSSSWKPLAFPLLILSFISAISLSSFWASRIFPNNVDWTSNAAT